MNEQGLKDFLDDLLRQYDIDLEYVLNSGWIHVQNMQVKDGFKAQRWLVLNASENIIDKLNKEVEFLSEVEKLPFIPIFKTYKSDLDKQYEEERYGVSNVYNIDEYRKVKQ